MYFHIVIFTLEQIIILIYILFARIRPFVYICVDELWQFVDVIER